MFEWLLYHLYTNIFSPYNMTAVHILYFCYHTLSVYLQEQDPSFKHFGITPCWMRKNVFWNLQISSSDCPHDFFCKLSGCSLFDWLKHIKTPKTATTHTVFSKRPMTSTKAVSNCLLDKLGSVLLWCVNNERRSMGSLKTGTL